MNNGARNAAILAAPILSASPALAEDPPSGTLASTMEVYVFPTEGQDASQQSKDEASCFEWAVDNTGSDPFSLDKEAEANEELAAAEMEAAEATGQGNGRDRLLFLDHELLRTELGARVGAVADRLVSGEPAGAPPVFARFDFHDLGGESGGLGLVHAGDRWNFESGFDQPITRSPRCRQDR